MHATPQYPFTLGLQYVADTVWVSIFPVLSTLVAPLVLTRLPQGQELLNTITDQQLEPFGGHWEERLHYGLFLAALFAWGLANWYGSRLLLQRDFMGSDNGFSPLSGFRYHWNMWFPRLLAAFGMALIALYIGISRKQWLAGAGAALAVVVFLLFVYYRRALFKVSAAPTERGGLSTADRVALWLSLSLTFVLLCSFSSVNWSMARFLGAPVILFLGLGSLVMMGAVVLTYLPLSYGWPSLAWLPFVVAFLLGLSDLNRNHDISARVLGDHRLDLAPRPDVAEHFARWLSHHTAGPIVLVAAEGGASRSAWWTSHVLSVLDYASQGEFSRHVYAVSGVSGGSLGAATYVALLAERGSTPVRSSAADLSFPSQRDCWDMRTARYRYSLPMQSECFLERDFLSPTLGYLLFPDLLQRIVPTKIPSWDRSLGLERSWQIDWRTLFERAPGVAPNPFAQSLDALYLQNGKVRDDIPVLFLNSARAQTGRSVLQSPVAIPSTELDDLFDARLYARGLPLSDVVHNSARFPLVSPGGQAETAERAPWDALVDGGYFENSGAATLAELLRALDACAKGDLEQPCPLSSAQWADAQRRIRVLFILNTPDDTRSVLQKVPPDPDPLFAPQKPLAEEELMTPLAGLYNSRSARGDSSKRFLLSLLPEREKQASEIFLLLHLDSDDKPLKQKKEDEPAMSWYLNQNSRVAMWRAVEAQRDKLCAILNEVNSGGVPDCPTLIDRFDAPPAGVRL